MANFLQFQNENRRFCPVAAHAIMEATALQHENRDGHLVFPRALAQPPHSGMLKFLWRSSSARDFPPHQDDMQEMIPYLCTPFLDFATRAVFELASKRVHFGIQEKAKREEIVQARTDQNEAAESVAFSLAEFCGASLAEFCGKKQAWTQLRIVNRAFAMSLYAACAKMENPTFQLAEVEKGLRRDQLIEKYAEDRVFLLRKLLAGGEDTRLMRGRFYQETFFGAGMRFFRDVAQMRHLFLQGVDKAGTAGKTEELKHLLKLMGMSPVERHSCTGHTWRGFFTFTRTCDITCDCEGCQLEKAVAHWPEGDVVTPREARIARQFRTKATTMLEAGVYRDAVVTQEMEIVVNGTRVTGNVRTLLEMAALKGDPELVWRLCRIGARNRLPHGMECFAAIWGRQEIFDRATARAFSQRMDRRLQVLAPELLVDLEHGNDSDSDDEDEPPLQFVYEPCGDGLNYLQNAMEDPEHPHHTAWCRSLGIPEWTNWSETEKYLKGHTWILAHERFFDSFPQ